MPTFMRRKRNSFSQTAASTSYTLAMCAISLKHAPYFAPGGGFHYSNTNYEILGLVAEKASGKPLNEGKRIAESTLTAIMGRLAAYTGKAVTWEKAIASTLDLSPAKYEFGTLPTPEVAVPGRTTFA